MADAARTLKSGFEVGQNRHDVKAGFIIRTSGSINLKSGFESQGILNLKSGFILDRSGELVQGVPVQIYVDKSKVT